MNDRMTNTVAEDWPRDSINGRLLCAPAHPMPKGASGQWSHTNLKSVGDRSYWDDYECRDCGHSFSVEVAE